MSEVIEFAKAEVGSVAPILSHKLGRTDLVKYAGASGDFNPMHSDEVAAKAAGQPSVFGHGMFSMGLLGSALTAWVGIKNIKSFGVRFTKQTWPDEILSTSIKVTSIEELEGKTLVTMDCSLSNQDGEVKVQGTATAIKP
jgi:acyl dehydratase